MKRYILLFVMMGTTMLSSLAQDDMYYVPKKKSTSASTLPRQVYYSGSNRNVDEYNRMGRKQMNGSSYQVIAGDSTMQDVITFTPVEGVYPDSATSVSTENDFQLTRNMARWDGYTPTDAYWEGYDRGRNDQWAINTWHSPWYYSSYYSWYDPWYYDPWYPHWSWRAGWYYDPWYYRPYHYYSWGWGGYYGGYYTPVRHRNSVYHSRTYSNGGYGRISAPSNSNVARSRTSGRSYVGNSNVTGNRSAGSRLSSPVRSSSSSTSPYSGNRSSSSSVTGNRSSSYSSGSTGSYGGNRSSGSFSGGGNRSGGSVGGSRGGGRRR
ncbi:hypothetical protein L6475_06495 [Prevotella sp. E9-3]|uniref:hypothetical protein n=1 Tax=Prevotella sp. E9-3 TaxID=2913621 RepID=UPI001EDA1773|nr:hypothetical protein [Prevotella sp. E9-3]UKK49576.1 hypothetical protein L6475_06495 [Prevotella sp. E9-3]